jgi:hypothetical protein
VVIVEARGKERVADHRALRARPGARVLAVRAISRRPQFRRARAAARRCKDRRVRGRYSGGNPWDRDRDRGWRGHDPSPLSGVSGFHLHHMSGRTYASDELQAVRHGSHASSVALLELELAGAVRRVEGGRFVRFMGRAKYSKVPMANSLVMRRITAKGKNDKQDISERDLQKCSRRWTTFAICRRAARRRRR